jgi:hypothetical protein
LNDPKNIERAIRSALTVEELYDELRAMLEAGQGAAKVLFTVDYGDYHHTMQALPVTGIGWAGAGHEHHLAETAYSHSRVCVEETPIGTQDEFIEAQEPVVILNIDDLGG